MCTFAAHKTDHDLYNLYRVCNMYKLHNLYNLYKLHISIFYELLKITLKNIWLTFKIMFFQTYLKIFFSKIFLFFAIYEEVSFEISKLYQN